ncbi:hypothetical protein BZA05DRAFT_428238 [Tricharina praecox]|uniref:uncharacterized protein n=1 Tax=Tricharina praecox TaxID=43433 RepID=UPI00221F9097|nr:uncharacterized protein BZA05DRAFT_428238 [Tricharina praecox]KAI5859224.1 hypothetical protein BZA05DRAFT_428238 [Tricharina praecox]
MATRATLSRSICSKPLQNGLSRCFSVFSARRGEFGPVTGGEKSEKERLKEEEGKQEAEAELTGKNSVESLARAQSVSWHRDSDNKPPSYQHRDLILPGRRGELVSTPSRLLKILLPLRPQNTDPTSSATDEPLALLIHPSQPLSYMERLIQAEIPPLEKSGITRPPDITFRAYNPDASDDAQMVRWSAATEVGDFVRDASKRKEFVIEIESGEQISVKVPSFRDRTRYLRQRLRAVSGEIRRYSDLKEECDRLAHRGAQHVAMAGFGGLITWWGAVWFATFYTSWGWEVMEPVTYLAGLTTVISGYLWFLYHNREVSYRSVLHITVSKRQMKLYAQKGFDIERWEDLVDQGKALRKEIKAVASEYDVEWDESKDELGDEGVKKVLQDDSEKKKKDRDDDDEDSLSRRD